MVKVLFVCTGNIFRSLSAEYLLKEYLKKNNIKGVAVSSAGTEALPQPIDPDVVKALRSYGADASHHKQRVLSKEILEENDVVIAMALFHKKFILKKFGQDVPLYNEFVGEGESSVWDVNDVVKDFLSNRAGVVEHIKKTIGHIHDSIPLFYRNLRSQMN